MSITLFLGATRRRLALAGTLGTLLLGGCAAPSVMHNAERLDEAWLEGASDCCQGLDALPLTSLAGHDEKTLNFGPETSVHRFETGPSPFHAMALPRGMGPLRLELISRVQRDDEGQLSLFAPRVLILDESGALQRQLDWQDFNYQPARGLNDDRLYLSLGVTPSAQADRVVVLTSDAARAADSQLLHPARARARARHLDEPAVVDPVAPHLASGRVTLRVRPLGESDGLLAPLVDSADRQPEPQRASASSTPREETREVPAASSDPLDWRRLMRTALKAGDIELAMQLAERARRAGDKDARAWLSERLQAR